MVMVFLNCLLTYILFAETQGDSSKVVVFFFTDNNNTTHGRVKVKVALGCGNIQAQVNHN